MLINPFASDVLRDVNQGAPELDDYFLHAGELKALTRVLARVRVEGGESAPSAAAAARTGEGSAVLLTAPRAGFGKTHLLARLKRERGELDILIPLRFDWERPVTWDAMLENVLEFGENAGPGSGSISLLEELARNVFSVVTSDMIKAGEIPCPDRDEALRALSSDPVELFNFGNTEKEVVRWFCGVFDKLLPSFAVEAEKIYGISREQALFWLRALYRYSRRKVTDDVRLSEVIRESADPNASEQARETAARERFCSVGLLLSRSRPLVLVADHLDGFFGDQRRGRELASKVLEFVRVVPQSVVVISANEDLWDSIFGRNLPAAFQDRLEKNRIELCGIDTVEKAQAIVDQRMGRAGIPDDVIYRFMPTLGLASLIGISASEGGISPRDVIRMARERWEEFESAGYAVAAGDAVASRGPATAEPDVAGGEARASGVEFISLSDAPEEGAEGRADAQSPKPLPKLIPMGELLQGGVLSAGLLPVRENHGSNTAAAARDTGGGGQGKAEPLSRPGAQEKASEGQSAERRVAGNREMRSGAHEDSGGLDGHAAGAAAGRLESHPKLVRGLRALVKKLLTSDQAAGGIAAESAARSGNAITGAASRPEPGSVEESRHLPTYYHRVRKHILPGVATETLDIERVGEVIRAVGKFLPVVVQKERALRGGANSVALSWSYENHEILFGFEDPRDHAFWRALAQHAMKRNAERLAAAERWEGCEVKAVLLAPAGLPFGLSSWLHALGVASREHILFDHVEIDRETVCSIYAVAFLLRESEAGHIPFSASNILGFAAHELDYFWRRLTRPSAALDAGSAI